MHIGIIGLPNVGKSSLFNALSSGHAAVSNYPFTTIEPNIGVISIPDRRIDRLADIYKPKKKTYATIRFVDIAGLVKGAHHGEGLGNKFLSHIRDVDAIVHVVRLFEDEQVAHSLGSIDPVRDIEIIETELLMADLESVNKQIESVSSAARSGEKKSREQLAILEKIRSALERGKPVRNADVSAEDLQSLFLLTAKPVLYVGNRGEGACPADQVQKVEQHAKEKNAEFLSFQGKLESEIAQLADDEKDTFRAEMGIEETGLERLIKKSFSLLNLITFFTGRSVEVKAWPIVKGTKAPQAAGKIHTDMEKGFIKAEVFSFDDIDKNGSEAVLREKGLIRMEGKTYTIQEGDVAYFRFNT